MWKEASGTGQAALVPSARHEDNPYRRDHRRTPATAPSPPPNTQKNAEE